MDELHLDGEQYVLDGEQYVVDLPFFDEEEIVQHCTVQILRNSQTGEVSIGWWREDEFEDDLK